MADIQIPKAFIAGFELLAKLNTKKAQEIANFLQQVPLGTGNKTFDTLFANAFPDLAPNILAPTIFSLSAFQGTEFEKVPAHEMADAIAEAFKVHAPDAGDDLLGNLKNNVLEIFVNLGGMFKSYKAFRLLGDNNKTFIEAKVVTDVRLVFDEEINNEAKDALIVHSLKITAEENNEKKEYYFSLDTNDLKKLKDTIERAEQKDKQIREQYANAISFITITE